MVSIVLVPEQIFAIGAMPVTNSLFTTWVGIGVVIAIVLTVRARLSLVPRGMQLVLESVYTFFANLCESVLGSKALAEKAVPFIASIFIFVFAANIIEVIPGVGTIGIRKEPAHDVEVPVEVTPPALEEFVPETETPTGYYAEPYQVAAPEKIIEEAAEEGHLVPLFRPPSTDLNTTLALALISVVVTQIVGLKALGVRYLSKFINFSNPISFFVGILELISEFAKIISFAFRLFGNIFAGEVLLTVMLMLVPYFVPLPFYGLEVFVAIVQAFIFAALTLIFIKIAITDHHEEEHSAQGRHV